MESEHLPLLVACELLGGHPISRHLRGAKVGKLLLRPSGVARTRAAAGVLTCEEQGVCIQEEA